MLEIRGWRLEIGGWRLEIGDLKRPERSAAQSKDAVEAEVNDAANA